MDGRSITNPSIGTALGAGTSPFSLLGHQQSLVPSPAFRHANLTQANLESSNTALQTFDTVHESRDKRQLRYKQYEVNDHDDKSLPIWKHAMDNASPELQNLENFSKDSKQMREQISNMRNTMMTSTLLEEAKKKFQQSKSEERALDVHKKTLAGIRKYLQNNPGALLELQSSGFDLVNSDVRSLRSQVEAQQVEIASLRETSSRNLARAVKAESEAERLRAIGDLKDHRHTEEPDDIVEQTSSVTTLSKRRAMENVQSASKRPRSSLQPSQSSSVALSDSGRSAESSAKRAAAMASVPEKAKQIWSLILIDWECTDEEKSQLFTQFSNVFNRGREVMNVRESIDKHVVGNFRGQPPYPRPCLFGILSNAGGGKGGAMTRNTCPWCKGSQERVCVWAEYAEGVASGYGERNMDTEVVTDTKWRPDPSPSTVSMNGRQIRWIIKKRRDGTDRAISAKSKTVTPA